MSNQYAGYSANEMQDIQNTIWIPDPKGSGWERVKNFDNMPSEYKVFLIKEDGFKLSKDGYFYSVKYWKSSDTFGVSRIKSRSPEQQQRQGMMSSSSSSSPSMPYKKTIYALDEMVSGTLDQINLILQRKPGNRSGFWQDLNPVVLNNEIIYSMVWKRLVTE